MSPYDSKDTNITPTNITIKPSCSGCNTVTVSNATFVKIDSVEPTNRSKSRGHKEPHYKQRNKPFHK